MDQLGNWLGFEVKAAGSTTLDQTRAHNDANEITGISETTGDAWDDPTYDASGNMTQGPAPGDETHTHKYIYDAWDRLVEVTDASDVTLASYEYDGLYRRIERREYASGSLSRTLHDYYSDAWQVLEVREDSEANAHEAETEAETGQKRCRGQKRGAETVSDTVSRAALPFRPPSCAHARPGIAALLTIFRCLREFFLLPPPPALATRARTNTPRFSPRLCAPKLSFAHL